jgi:hypothetical protein
MLVLGQRDFGDLESNPNLIARLANEGLDLLLVAH